MIKSRRMRWTGNVEHMTEKRNDYEGLVGKPVERRPLEELDVREIILLKWFLEKKIRVLWTGSFWPRIKISGSVKY
jgi:hypothetical protein